MNIVVTRRFLGFTWILLPLRSKPCRSRMASSAALTSGNLTNAKPGHNQHRINSHWLIICKLGLIWITQGARTSGLSGHVSFDMDIQRWISGEKFLYSSCAHGPGEVANENHHPLDGIHPTAILPNVNTATIKFFPIVWLDGALCLLGVIESNQARRLKDKKQRNKSPMPEKLGQNAKDKVYLRPALGASRVCVYLNLDVNDLSHGTQESP